MGAGSGVSSARRLEGWAIWSFVAFFVVYYALYVLHHSDFNSDDLDNFLLMRRMDFLPFLLTPSDVHFVPLHRLLTWLVFHMAPMNFGVAVGLLTLFHVGTLIYLCRIGRLFSLGEAGGVAIGAYAASSVIAFGLVWWAHAQHRVPYVFFDVVAIYHYLAWLRQGGRKHVVLAACALILAMGFYEKAVLIPVHMLVFGWLMRERVWGRNSWKLAAPPLALLGLSGLYVALYIWLHPAGLLDEVAQLRSVQMTALAQYGNESAALSRLLVMDPWQLRWHLWILSCQTELEFLKQLAGAGLGLASEGPRDMPFGALSLRGWTALLFTGTFYALSLWRFPGTWKALLALPLLLGLDFAPIAFSNRGTIMGMHTAHSERFLYEELHVVALFAMAWWAKVLAAKPSFRDSRPLWAAAFACLVVYGGINVSNLRSSASTPWNTLWFMQLGHDYAHNLRRGLQRIHEPQPSFANSEIPGYMSVFGLMRDTRTLLPLFLQNARFDQPSPDYEVTQDGHVVRLSANPRRPP